MNSKGGNHTIILEPLKSYNVFGILQAISSRDKLVWKIEKVQKIEKVRKTISP